MTYNESSARMQARLEAEDRWDEFKARKKELRAEFEAEGHPKPGSAAYQQCLKEFAPPAKAETTPQHETADDPDELVPLDDFGDSAAATDAGAIRWTAEHIAVADVKPADAPSRSAWALLAWARRKQNQHAFWSQIFTKVLPTRSQVEGHGDEHDPGIAAVEDVLDEIHKRMEQGMLEALRRDEDLWHQVVGEIKSEIKTAMQRDPDALETCTPPPSPADPGGYPRTTAEELAAARGIAELKLRVIPGADPAVLAQSFVDIHRRSCPGLYHDADGKPREAQTPPEVDAA